MDADNDSTSPCNCNFYKESPTCCRADSLLVFLVLNICVLHYIHLHYIQIFNLLAQQLSFPKYDNIFHRFLDI